MNQVADYDELNQLLRCVAEIHHDRVMAKWGELSTQYKGVGQRVRILREWLISEKFALRADVFSVDLDAKGGAPVAEDKMVHGDLVGEVKA